MREPDAFTTYHKQLIKASYDCMDRLMVNAYFRLGQTGGGFRHWWRALHGSDEQLDNAHLMRIPSRFSRRLRAWAKENGVPVIDCPKGTRKHDVALKYKPKDPNFKGVFLILVSKAPAMVWQVRRAKTGSIDLVRKQPWPHVNHYAFHIMDPDWGHIVIILSPHPPFGATVLLNGHEWVERQAAKEGLSVTKEGNCFTECEQFPRLNQIADTSSPQSSIGRLAQVIDRWIYSACLCFALETQDQERSRFRYEYSVHQVEYSTNLLFKDANEMEQVYQGMLDRTRRILDIRTVRTVLGWQKRRRASSKGAQVSIATRDYDLTVFKVQMGPITIRMYDKGERLLRCEVVVNNTRKLGSGRAIQSLGKIVTTLEGILTRFLDVLRSADVAFLNRKILDELPLPTARGASRLAGVDVNKVRMRKVMAAALGLATQPCGFTAGELAEKVCEVSGWDASRYGPRHASYDLRKLSGKGIVQRQGRRYHASSTGIRVMVGISIYRDQLLEPIMAGLTNEGNSVPPPNASPIDAHYATIQRELIATMAHLQLVA